MSINNTFFGLSKIGKALVLPSIMFGTMLAVAACSVTKLEDVMGPGVKSPQIAVPAAPKALSLASPPPDLSDPAKGNNNIEVETIALGYTLARPILAGESVVSPLIAAGEEQSNFSVDFPWRAIVGPDGIDATNAEGTICSGRYATGTSKLTSGSKIELACSDGETAQFQLLSLQPNALKGSLKIGKSTFGVALQQIARPSG